MYAHYPFEECSEALEFEKVGSYSKFVVKIVKVKVKISGQSVNKVEKFIGS